MIGRGEACGAVTVVNAIAAGRGCAVGVDLQTWAEVELSPGEGVAVRMEGLPEEPSALVELCVSQVLERFSVRRKATVRTGSQIPVSRGLKSSSAAANAVILATLDALGERMDDMEVLRMNARASMEAGVSVTGASGRRRGLPAGRGGVHRALHGVAVPGGSTPCRAGRRSGSRSAWSGNRAAEGARGPHSARLAEEASIWPGTGVWGKAMGLNCCATARRPGRPGTGRGRADGGRPRRRHLRTARR